MTGGAKSPLTTEPNIIKLAPAFFIVGRISFMVLF